LKSDNDKLLKYVSRWSNQGRGIEGGRCGCGKSIAYFMRTGIDLEWIQSEAERTSKGFQRELKETADDLRKQVSGVIQARDDAVADNEVYIDQNIKLRNELKVLCHTNVSVSNELSAIKSELSARKEVERVARAYFLMDAGGREKVCPVPTMDGVLISLEDVYRGWMGGMGCEGLGFQFQCPVYGKTFFICMCTWCQCSRI